MTDWLDELYQLREADKQNQTAPESQTELDLSLLQRPKEAADLLRQCDAHKLLRRVQRALLDGKGIIDFFEQAGTYDRIISLIWQGPISNARTPNPEDPEPYQYIFVGVRNGKVYVNGKPLPTAIPEALKEALVEASKNPRRKAVSKKK